MPSSANRRPGSPSALMTEKARTISVSWASVSRPEGGVRTRSTEAMPSSPLLSIAAVIQGPRFTATRWLAITANHAANDAVTLSP